MINAVRHWSFITVTLRKRTSAFPAEDTQGAGSESKKSSTNAFFSAQIAIVKSMQACSFSGKPLLKNRVNSGKPYNEGNPERSPPKRKW